jgi:DNA (cytosine-5)-methyltransferase 1
VFVVGCLGNWESSAEVLFESESLSGNTQPSRKTREETANSFIPSVANCLQTTSNDYSRAEGLRIYKESTSTLCVAAGTGGGNVPLTMAYALQGAGSTSQNANGSGYKKEQSFTLNVTDVHGVAQFCDTYNGTIQGNVAATMTADMAGPTHSGPKIMQNMAVRRLTEVECERLQGFPDNYTNIKENCPSGARYKALGNSMAVPVMKWIGERINEYERKYGRN